jgi:hypothetical protein
LYSIQAENLKSPYEEFRPDAKIYYSCLTANRIEGSENISITRNSVELDISTISYVGNFDAIYP